VPSVLRIVNVPPVATRIGIDTGGTFTDVVRWTRNGVHVHKLPSTPGDPSQAVLQGLAAVRRHPGEAVDVVHGTTVGLNAVLTGQLARTAFVTNRGFEDLIEIGRQQRTDLYSLTPHRPVPPVPRELRLGVDCRRGPDGTAETPLRKAEIERTIARLRQLRPAAVAVGFLHSPAAPDDERKVAAAVRRALPGVPVTCSAELLPAFGEYERFTAAILNAAIAPVVGGYTRRLRAGIGNGQLRLLRSSLGILPPDEAAAFPARAMFSGPAGGVLATAQAAASAGYERAVAFDMGGTSADVCLVHRGNPSGDDGMIAGLPLPLPTVAVHTVGCGGGSIAYVDAGGSLRVGPQSAGADPGPACYGKGEEPTVTDAHLALGHLGPDTLLQGAFPIDVDAAVRTIERLGKRLGLGAAATAHGILTIADVTMARAILVITAERAVDPAQVPLCAYGGAGGLHAAGLLARLHMPRALMPLHPGAFSALGLCLAGESHERSEAVRVPADRPGLARLRALGLDLANQARAGMPGRPRARVDALVRYRGQGAGLWVPMTARLAAAFAAEHERRYGFVAETPLEVVQLRARAEAAHRPFPRTDTRESNRPGNARPAVAEVRRRPPVGGAVLPVFRRADLNLGDLVKGPAIVEEATATTLIPEGYEATLHTFGLELTGFETRRKRPPQCV
jgi:N-methylhydantoinase A